MAVIFMISFVLGYGAFILTVFAVAFVFLAGAGASVHVNREKGWDKVHAWIRNAPIVNIDQINSKYESIDRIHGRKEVRNQILRLEDLLLDLYVKPWFFHLIMNDLPLHIYNDRQVFVMEADPTSQHPIMANMSEQATINGTLIKKNSLFLTSLRYYFRIVILELKTRIERVDWTNFIMELIIPLVTQHIHDYKRAVQEVNQRGNRNLSASEELDLFTASTFRQGRLHVALGGGNNSNLNKSRFPNSTTLPISTIECEYEYLRHQFDHIIPKLLPMDDNSVFLHCILREIVVVFVIQPLLSMLAEPDFWNQKIDTFATKAIKEQKMVSKLREALDKPFLDEQSTKIKIPPKMPSFEKYLEIIKGCKNLLDLKRIHNSIMTEIQRKQTLILDRNDRDIVNGRRVIDLKKYIHRLKIALRKTEKKIIELGGKVGNEIPSPNENSRCSSPFRSPTSDAPAIDYSDIHNLLVEPGLSYFREYIETSDELDILQFYCAVQALSVHLTESSGRISPFSSSAINMTDFETKKILRTDILSIYGSYLLDSQKQIVKRLDLDKGDIKNLFGNIESAKIASDDSISAALEYLRGVQMKARNYLQMFSYSFQQSDAYFRLLSDPNRVSLEAERKDISPITRKRLTSTVSRSSDPKFPKLSIDTSLVADTSVQHDASEISAMSKSTEMDRRSPSIAMLSPSIAHGNDSMQLFANSYIQNSPSIDLKDQYSRALVDSLGNEINTSSEYDPVHLVQMEIESIIEKESQADDGSDEEDDDHLEFSDEEDISPGYNDEDSDEVDSDHEDLKSLKSHNSKTGESSAKYEADVKRIETNLAKIRQQKILLQYMNENPNTADTKNQYREQKLLRKMRFQFEQEEKILENEKRQLQWKIDGTLIIPGQTKISIPNFELVESQVKSKKPFVIYFIETRQPRQSFADLEQTGWMMVRRYSEFHALHRHLKEAFPEVMNKAKIEFPGKRFITTSRVKSALFSSSNQSLNDQPTFPSTKDQEFIEHRRKDLETYLSKVTMESEIAKSWIFRQFLCEDKQYTFKGMTMLPIKTSLSNMFTGLSSRLKIDRMKVKEPKKKKSIPLISPETFLNEDEAAVDNDGIFEFSQNKGAETLSSLLLELFDLNEKSNWWRRQAIMWVMQQFLGGTFERRISDFIDELVDDEHLSFFVTSLNDMMDTWSTNSAPVIRSQTEKTRSRLSVYKKLNLLIPDMTSSIVGRSNAKRGSNRLFDLLQNRRLNQDLIYRATDLIFKKMFNTTH